MLDKVHVHAHSLTHTDRHTNKHTHTHTHTVLSNNLTFPIMKNKSWQKHNHLRRNEQTHKRQKKRILFTATKNTNRSHQTTKSEQPHACMLPNFTSYTQHTHTLSLPHTHTAPSSTYM